MSRLIQLLQDGRFHSGEELGAALGVSRSAVWKQLQRLQSEFGVVVHKVRGRGYQLAGPVILLQEKAFVGRYLSWDCAVCASIDSTNAEALRRLEAGVRAPFALVAERQTAGRGRRGRAWVSPFGENLYFSLVLPIEYGARQLEGLSLVVGLAVLRTLKKVGVSNIGLKWPNDLLADGRKIAGILLELVGDPADMCHVVIGVGVNVNMRSTEMPIEQAWTSVLLQSGQAADRNELLADLQFGLDEYLAQHARDGFSALRDEWEANHLWQGAQVSLIAGSQQIEGVVLGVDGSGALRLRVSGEERTFSGGELSLRLSNDS